MYFVFYIMYYIILCILCILFMSWSRCIKIHSLLHYKRCAVSFSLCLKILVNCNISFKLLNIFSRTMSRLGFQNALTELVSFVGHLATEGLRLENCHILLLNHTLNFYETVTQPCFVLRPWICFEV